MSALCHSRLRELAHEWEAANHGDAVTYEGKRVVDILNEQAASHAQKGMALLTRTSKGRRITQTCTHQRHDSPVCVLVVPRPHTQIVILSIPVSLRVESSAPMRVVLGERDDTSLACRAEQRV